MRGVVIYPNGPSPHAIIQREDGCLCAVDVFHDGALRFMDSVEMKGLELQSHGFLQNLTLGLPVEVELQKLSDELTWDETVDWLKLGQR